MAASAISNLLRKNVGAGLARVSLNKNIIRNYFSLVFSVDKRAFKRRVWFDFKTMSIIADYESTAYGCICSHRRLRSVVSGRLLVYVWYTSCIRLFPS